MISVSCRVFFFAGLISACGIVGAAAEEEDSQDHILGLNTAVAEPASGNAAAGERERILTGNGTLVTDKREIAPFNLVFVNGEFDLDIHPSAAGVFSVEVRADANLLENIRTTAGNDQLHISAVKPFSSSSRVLLTVRMPRLRGIYSSGDAHVRAGSVRSDILTVHVAGNSVVTLEGQAMLLRCEMTGGELEALRLNARRVDLRMSGTARARVWAADRLTVNAADNTEVFYRGRPSRILRTLSGSAAIDQLTMEPDGIPGT